MMQFLAIIILIFLETLLSMPVTWCRQYRAEQVYIFLPNQLVHFRLIVHHHLEKFIKMKIQIEQDEIKPKPSSEKISLLSYQIQIKEGKEKKSYQAVIPKSLADVQLSDVKQALPTNFSKAKLHSSP